MSNRSMALRLESERPEVQAVAMPVEIAKLLREFLLDKHSGTVQLNIRMGQILGAVVTRQVQA